MSNAIPLTVGRPPRAAELLSAEFATFQRELARLIQEGEQGRWALVHGEEVASIWDTFPDAVQAGYDRFGLVPFLVQQVVPVHPPAQSPWQRPECQS